MARDASEDDGPGLSPDEAFAKVGNETRMQILQILGEAEPLNFSELYDRVDIADTGNFTYHLDKLTGHFVREAEGEYRLREPGSSVVESVLSGVVTDVSELEPTRLDAGCPYCGNSVEVSFTDERVMVRCTACPGTYTDGRTDARFLESHPYGTIAIFRLPPAGLYERSPLNVLETALARTHLELLELAERTCPRCSADVSFELQICEEHSRVDGICDVCRRRRAVYVDYQCVNCIRVEENIPAGLHLVRDPALMAFLSNHGINPVMPDWGELAAVVGYDEDITSTEPLEAAFTFHADGDSLTLTVDEQLTVIDVSEGDGTE